MKTSFRTYICRKCWERDDTYLAVDVLPIQVPESEFQENDLVIVEISIRKATPLERIIK